MKKCYEKVFHENKNNLRETWNVINKVLSKTSNRNRLEIKSRVNDNRIYTDGFEICELFNDFFTSESSRSHESIPSLIIPSLNFHRYNSMKLKARLSL